MVLVGDLRANRFYHCAVSPPSDLLLVYLAVCMCLLRSYGFLQSTVDEIHRLDPLFAPVYTDFFCTNDYPLMRSYSR